MATWNDMTDLSAGDVVSEQNWDYFQGNIEYLLDPNKDVLIVDNSGDYTTTSTSFVDVHATELASTFTTAGGPVLVYFVGTMSAAGGTASIAWDVDLDGTRHGAAFAQGIQEMTVGAGNHQFVGFSFVTDSLAAGSHTFKLQWKVSAQTGELYSGSGSGLDVGLLFGAIEV